MKRFIYLLPAIVLLLLLPACSSSRRAGVKTGDYSESMPLQEKFRLLVDNYHEWECVEVPVKLSIKAPSTFSLSGKAYMKRGKDIMLSLRFMGLEVAMLYVDKDSIYVSDKVHKYYVAEKIGNVLSGCDVSVGDIQDFLIGRAFTLGSGTLAYGQRKKVSLEDAGDCWLIIPREKAAAGTEYGFSVRNADNSLAGLVVSVPGVEPVNVAYSENVKTLAGWLADKVRFGAVVNDKAIDVEIDWTFSRAAWNAPGNFRTWKTPQGYNRLKTPDIAKMLSSF